MLLAEFGGLAVNVGNCWSRSHSDCEYFPTVGRLGGLLQIYIFSCFPRASPRCGSLGSLLVQCFKKLFSPASLLLPCWALIGRSNDNFLFKLSEFALSLFSKIVIFCCNSLGFVSGSAVQNSKTSSLVIIATKCNYFSNC